MKPANRFTKGTGAYRCGSCQRLTRSTGRGDNENVRLCAECFDLAGEENHLSDTGKLYSSPAEVLRLIEAVRAKSGYGFMWADLKAKAEALAEVPA